MNNVLTLEKISNGVMFKVHFKHKINVIKGSSGTGKSFLFSELLQKCNRDNVPAVLIDYRVLTSSNVHLIEAMCKGKQVVLLDNADLYLTSELFDKIRSMDNVIVMSKKTTFGLNMKDARQYVIEYNNDTLSVRGI